VIGRSTYHLPVVVDSARLLPRWRRGRGCCPDGCDRDVQLIRDGIKADEAEALVEEDGMLVDSVHHDDNRTQLRLLDRHASLQSVTQKPPPYMSL